jgi:hypothetical protein
VKQHCIVGGYKLFCKPSSLEKEGRLVKRMGWDALKLPVQFLLILGTSMLLSIFFADAYIINSAGERKKRNYFYTFVVIVDGRKVNTQL